MHQDYVSPQIWCIDAPKLVISVHGGMSNFELQDKLGRQFRGGLLKVYCRRGYGSWW